MLKKTTNIKKCNNAEKNTKCNERVAKGADTDEISENRRWLLKSRFVYKMKETDSGLQ